MTFKTWLFWQKENFLDDSYEGYTLKQLVYYEVKYH